MNGRNCQDAPGEGKNCRTLGEVSGAASFVRPLTHSQKPAHASLAMLLPVEMPRADLEAKGFLRLHHHSRQDKDHRTRTQSQRDGTRPRLRIRATIVGRGKKTRVRVRVRPGGEQGDCTSWGTRTTGLQSSHIRDFKGLKAGDGCIRYIECGVPGIWPAFTPSGSAAR